MSVVAETTTTGSLRIVADAAIPWLDEAFGRFGSIERLPGREIGPAQVERADVLLVRTLTRVDDRLLGGSTVRFVGSATAGIEHVDVEALRRSGIRFAHAPGANAIGVVEYVLTALLLVATSRPAGWLRSSCLGVVGFGNIGRRLTVRARNLGMPVVVCDPPLQELRDRAADDLASFTAPDRELIEREHFYTLPEVLSRANVVTLHVPYTEDGRPPTRGLIDAAALRMFDGDLLLQTSRGGIVQECDLLQWLGGNREAVLDVWEREPHVDAALLQHPHVRLATPHIAGYTEGGKARATAAIAGALATFLGQPYTFDAQSVMSAVRELHLATSDTAIQDVAALATTANPLQADEAALRALASRPAAERAAGFDGLRRSYAFRPEFSQVRVSGVGTRRSADETLPCSLAQCLSSLGFASSLTP